MKNTITINDQKIVITHHDNLISLFASMTSTRFNVKHFKLTTEESEKMNLIILEIKTHESISGTGFYFKAIGESFKADNPGKRIPITFPLEGFIDF